MRRRLALSITVALLSLVAAAPAFAAPPTDPGQQPTRPPGCGKAAPQAQVPGRCPATLP